MNRQHTPGPWELSGPFGANDYDDNEGYWRVAAARTLFLTVAPCSDGFVDGENAANARLIAAAPELLDALDALRHHVEHHEDCSWPESACNCGSDEALIVARAAIDKATGAA